MREFFERLRERGIIILPVRGKGKKLEEAKIPILPRGIKYTVTEPRWIEVSKRAYKLLLSGKITAYGVPGAPNHFNILDFDADKFPINKFEGLWRKLARNNVYIEKTASDGIHVIAGGNKKLIAQATHIKYSIDTKTFGYVIAAPSRLVVDDVGVFSYVKLKDSVNLYDDLAELDEVQHILTEYGIDVYGTNEVRRELTAKETSVPILNVGKFRHWRHAVACLAYVLKKLNCAYYKLLMNILNGKWNIPYRKYVVNDSIQHSRSSWGIIEYNIGVLLRILNVDDKLVVEFTDYLEEIQGEDPAHTRPAVEQGYKYAYWGLDLRGACVLRYLGLCENTECDHNVVTLVLANINRVRHYATKFMRVLKNANSRPAKVSHSSY